MSGGVPVKVVVWPDTVHEKGKTLRTIYNTELAYKQCVDGMWWVVQYVNDVEVARHNPRYLESILFFD